MLIQWAAPGTMEQTMKILTLLIAVTWIITPLSFLPIKKKLRFRIHLLHPSLTKKTSVATAASVESLKKDSGLHCYA